MWSEQNLRDCQDLWRGISGDLRFGRFLRFGGRDAGTSFEQYAFVDDGAGADERDQLGALTFAGVFGRRR